MANGNGSVGRIITVDVMKTVVELQLSSQYPTAAHAIARVYAEITGKEVDDHFSVFVQHRLACWRRVYANHPDIHTEQEYWKFVNGSVLQEILGQESDEADLGKLALGVHRRFNTDTDLYSIQDDMLAALARLKDKCQELDVSVVSGSNQSMYGLNTMLDHFEVGDFFDVRLCSGNLDVRKPSRAFWDAIRGRQNARILVHIGNSFDNDAPAAKRSIPVVLIDRDGSVRERIDQEWEEQDWVRHRIGKGHLVVFRDPDDLVDAVIERLE